MAEAYFIQRDLISSLRTDLDTLDSRLITAEAQASALQRDVQKLQQVNADLLESMADLKAKEKKVRWQEKIKRYTWTILGVAGGLAIGYAIGR